MTDLAGVRDQTAERLLDRHGLTWHLQTIDPDTIDWPATRARQTRDTLVNDDVVERYRANVAAGDIFPPVIAITNDTGRHELLAGVHRAQAHEAEAAPLAAYVLTGPIDELTAYLIAIEDNATHGQPLSNDERARHALRLIDELGLSREEAARRVGLSMYLVHREANIRDFDRRIQRFGLPGKKLPATAKWRLQQSTARRADVVFIEAVTAASNVRANAVQCIDLASGISAAGSDEEALQVIEDFKIAHHDASAGGGPGPAGVRRPAHAVRDAARAFLEVPPDVFLASLLPGDRAITLDLIARTGTRAAHLARQLATPQETP